MPQHAQWACGPNGGILPLVSDEKPAEPPADTPPQRKLKPMGRRFDPKGRFGKGPKGPARQGKPPRARAASEGPAFLDDPIGWIEHQLWGPEEPTREEPQE